YHPIAFDSENFAKLGFAFIDQIQFPEFVVFGHAPGLAVFFESVEMAVRPTHRNLESGVKAAQLYRTRDLDPTPDRWNNFGEGDLQFVEERCGSRLRGHGDIVQRGW